MSNDKDYKYTIPFDGKTINYMMWRRKFMSLCGLKHCEFSLTRDPTNMPPESTDLDDTNDKSGDLRKWRSANTLAYSMLTLACNDYVSLQQLEAACTVKLPSGCAYLAWKNLETIHKPKNNSNQVDLEQQFNHCELKSENKNPDEWFAELETIRARLQVDFKVNISEEKLNPI